MLDETSKSESAIATSEKEDTEMTNGAIDSKKKVCRYFKAGFCGYGEKCIYKHSKTKIRPRLGFNNPSDVENCRFYKKASCKFASKCWYHHIRPNGKPFPKPDPVDEFIVVGPSGDGNEKTDAIVGTPDKDSADISVPETEPHRSFKRPQNLEIISKNCFYFEQKGRCYYGDKCWYNHSESSIQMHSADELNESEPESEFPPDHTKMCYNFVFEVCELGSDCPYIHGDICQFCDLAFLHPFDEQQRKDHLKACETFFLADMDISFTIMRSKAKTCGICLDYVWGPNKLYTKCDFGIQSECNHIFCLDCIRYWRTVKMRNNEPKLCPACRMESLVVVPSTHWYENDKEKKEWISNYKAKLRNIPCKFYTKGRCKNRENCLYFHARFIPSPEMRDENMG